MLCCPQVATESINVGFNILNEPLDHLLATIIGRIYHIKTDGQREMYSG